jgi:hypothetical protein
VHNMLDTLTFSGCLQRLKETAFASSSAKPSKKNTASQQQSQAQQQEDDDADDDDAPAAAPARSSATSASAADLELCLCLCCEALTNLAAMAQQVQLRGSQEVLQAGLEGCSDLLCCSKTAKVPAGSKGLGLSAGGQTMCTPHFCCPAWVLSAVLAVILQRATLPQHKLPANTCLSINRQLPLCLSLREHVPGAWLSTPSALAHHYNAVMLLQAASALLRIRCWRVSSAPVMAAWRTWQQWCCRA